MAQTQIVRMIIVMALAQTEIASLVPMLPLYQYAFAFYHEDVCNMLWLVPNTSTAIAHIGLEHKFSLCSPNVFMWICSVTQLVNKNAAV